MCVIYILYWLCLVFIVLSTGTPNIIVEAISGGLSASIHLSEETSASLISRWTFSWVGSVIWKAFRAHLSTSDLHELNWDDTARITSRLFSKVTPATLKLVWRLYHFTKHDLFNQGAWAVLFSLTSFCPAFLLRYILDYLDSPSTMSQNNAWLCVGGLLVAGIVTGIADCQCEWLGRKISVRLRAILIDQIFSKVLKKRISRPTKSSSEEGDSSEDIHATDGTILNLMAVDAANVSVASLSLYSILGSSGILGVMLMIALLPLNVLVSKRQVAAQMKVLSAADARVQASNELITNIRVIKLCAWEEEFRRKIRLLRTTELSELRVRFFWWSISMTVFYSLPFITTILTLFIYTIVEKQKLETKVAFPALAIFAVLRIPLDRMSSMISFILQAQVSIGRIEKFLKEKETSREEQLMGSDARMIGFDNATLEWSVQDVVGIGAGEDIQPAENPPTHEFRLSNLEIKFHKNGLNLVCGPSGSGKSSLLLALLGEMELLRGRVHLPLAEQPIGDDTSISDVAYCPQEPWIMNQTIRANILFGLHFQSHRYKMVLDAVALSRDLAVFENGDLAIAGPLMEGRTCILATHHSQLVLPYCDYAVFLENGIVKRQGTASELMQLDFTGENTLAVIAKHGFRPIDFTHHPQIVASPLLSLGASETDSSDSWIGNINVVSETKDESIYSEDQMTGAVSLSVIRVYLKSMGGRWFWAVVFFAFGLQQITSLGTNLWIKVWAHEFDEAEETSPMSHVKSVYYLAVYGLICVAYVLVSFVRDLTTFSGALKASAQIFDRLLDSIIHAPLIFFDKIPFGQITNRFSRDVEAVDQEVAPHSMSTFFTFCSLSTVIILISITIPLFIPAAVIICLAYYIITLIYINSARDLKRIESVQRSPLYQHFGEALAGYVSVRAYGHANRFTEENHVFIDGYNQPYVLNWAAKEWLTLRIASLSALISWLTGTFLLWGLGRGTVNAGIAGLVLTYAATFSDNVLWFVQLYAIVQQSFNSVERIVEYTEIKREPSEPLEPSSYDLSPQWPIHGHVRFQGYTARYAPELSPALFDLNLDMHGGQRVAVVGRTGAGKSTLALALIRAVEADTGRITIDGISIASVNLVRLRRAVTVVPQDPTLFGGSLRHNLDPLNHYSDDDIHDVLRRLQFFQSLPSGDLDHPAAALSMGQRQLVCIARALLRRSRILILDEATASIDHATDALIQAGLRSSIADGITVLTIAHRLLTIADYDRVMVLDSGRIVEQGSVAELFQKRGDGAFFRQLCEQSGDLAHIERIVRGL
ncbi:ABC transporter domain-containing protein [Trichoderma breve]|uniref:ABC transporter domain-containing protein n=1 Tax=Trichoderma breve TaxID=2034170 RepID=A0A9W9BDK1_9HYPO|nr:ABC transporter domain-containing protein [Trichoderma breve]KAJ4861308.1 ABC transporter domain-containing protein [Trichoderma breve]